MHASPTDAGRRDVLVRDGGRTSLRDHRDYGGDPDNGGSHHPRGTELVASDAPNGGGQLDGAPR